jgi:signal transduction histidine kinase
LRRWEEKNQNLTRLTIEAELMANLANVISLDARGFDTLTAFLQDAEHDIMAVVTALQAHIDVLRDECLRNHMPADRFVVLNRSIARIVSDMSDLASISETANSPRSKHKLILEAIVQEITAETRAVFSNNSVLLACDIAEGTTLLGDPDPVKAMITRVVLSLLAKCKKLETVKIVGLRENKRVSLSFTIGLEPAQGAFKSWRLGDLRLMHTNGEGIGLSAVDAMARLHNGQLSVSHEPNERHGYKLTFKV